MTNEDRLLLADLKNGTQQLFEAFSKIESDKALLEEKILNQKQEIEMLKQEKLDLEQKNEQLKVATQILSESDDNEAAKQKIDFLVREIDKCIALLNK